MTASLTYVNIFYTIIQKKYARHVTDNLLNPHSEDLSLELIEELVRYICNTKDLGAILIFLPGMMDISKLNRMMLDSGCYPSRKYIRVNETFIYLIVCSIDYFLKQIKTDSFALFLSNN